jgi:uncharacterized protein (TIGR02001 family)
LAAALSAAAADEDPLYGGELTGSLTGTSDYTYRGISQTQDGPALQGSIDLSYPIAPVTGMEAYVGAWASTVRFGTASLETDLVGGVRGTVGESKFGYDLGFIWYTYPGADNRSTYEYWEWGELVNYDFEFIKPYAGLRWSPDFFGGSGKSTYKFVGFTAPLPGNLPLQPRLAGQIGKMDIQKNAVFGTPDYTDYMLGVTITAFTLDWSAQYIDTDISRAQCSGGTDACESRVVLSVAKTF